MQTEQPDLAALEDHDVVAPEDHDVVAPEKKAKVPVHMKNFYARFPLDEKGVWAKHQRARSMRAYLLRGQLTSFGSQVNERFGRLDRKRAVDKLVKEGKAIKTVPRNVRETAGVIHPATVDALLDSLPEELKATPESLTAAIGQLFGFREPERIRRFCERAKKWVLRNPGRRMPMHIREGAVLSTAVAIAAVKLFPESVPEEARDAVADMRAKYGMEAA